MDNEAIIDRINSLLNTGGVINKDHGVDSIITREVYSGALYLITGIFGPDSPHVESLKESNSRIMKYGYGESTKNLYLLKELRGVLQAVKVEVESGLLKNIRTEAKAEILADFIFLAKEAMDSGVKDVAAVLACASLEDSLKRFAESAGLNVSEKSLSEVLNAIKSGGHMSRSQAKVVQSFVGVRNKALHADWEKIDESEIHSIIGFVQSFLMTRFN